MDDSIDSMLNEDKAVKLLQQLRELWRKAGMHPRKLLPNSKSFGRNRYKGQSKQIDLSMNDLPSLKIWEVMWLTLSGQFSYMAALLVEDIVLTLKKFLSKISKQFNPLQFVTPFVVRAKILMQEVWVWVIDWNDLFPEIILDKAKKLFAGLKDLANVKIWEYLTRSATQVVPDHYFPIQVEILTQQSCMKEMHMKIDLYQFL